MRGAPPLLLFVLFAACSGDAAWQRLGPGDVERFAPQRSAAEAARDALGSRLLAELTAALAEGPAHAIEVCSERAPAIAREVAAERSVAIGRTSSRRRNPANAPPPWAAEHVGSAAADAAYFEGPDRRFGALFPIRVMPLCIQCHGQAGELAAGVRDAIARRYPDDRATGFATGDLRGWFWVEVPSGG
jgi:hypothetical protein